MQISNVPNKFAIPFANSAGAGYIRAIPQASQIGITNGAASLTDGFPPLTFLPVGAGGTPPWGQDFNGILNQITLWSQWQAAGGQVIYDSAFSTAIGGYPAGAIVASVNNNQLWYNTTDNNTTNPDSATSVGWQPIMPVITANTTYYINNSTGSDTNNGTTTGTAWATIAHALTTLQNYNLNGNTVTLQLATTGTSYAVPNSMTAPSNGTLLIQGQVGSQSSVTIAGTGIAGSGFMALSGGSWQLQYLTLQNQSTGGVNGVIGNAATASFQNCTFTGNQAGNTGWCLFASAGATFTLLSGNIFSPQSCGGAIECANGGTIIQSANQTCSGTFAVATAFCNCTIGGIFTMTQAGFTWTGGTVTGPRYSATLNSIINTNGGGANFFPGSTVGSTATGGQYA